MSEDRVRRTRERGSRTRWVWTTAVLLFALGLIPRLVNLGQLSFYADEDISVLTATATVEGEGSVLPSGMAYRRALPFTWVNAASVSLFGEPSELAVRLPSAILGALTIPALFLLGRRWMGFGAGLTAAALLAVSEWHLAFSRQSRMYVVLLLFVVLATWALWTWARTGRRDALAAGLLTGLIATLLHRLAILLAGVPLIWLAFPGALAVSIPAVLLVSGGIAAAGWAIDDFWVVAPYGALPTPPRVPVGGAEAAAAAPAGGFGTLDAAVAIVGLLLAVGIVRRLGRPDDEEPGAHLRRIAKVALALLAGVSAGLGQVYAFAVFGALFLLLEAGGVGPILSRAPLSLIGLFAILALRVGLRIPDAGLVEAVKLSAGWPYPHAYTLVLQDPIPTVLFGAVTLTLILIGYRESRWGMAAASMLVFGMLAALGLVREAGPTRYLITAYPLMMLVAGGGIYEGLRWLADRATTRTGGETRWAAPAAGAVAVGLVLAGAFPGHGIPVAARVAGLEHGEPVNELTHMFPFRPDHRSVGRYVRERRGEEDVVIVEDPIVQAWYAGRIDYWFRRYGDMRTYLRVHPDGSIHDIYAGSEPIADPALADSIAGASPAPVWFITSGETAALPRYYLSPEQREWLDSLRRAAEPVFVGEDGVSAVYCLNCDPGTDGAGVEESGTE